MPVISLSKQDVGAEHHLPSLLRSDSSPAKSKKIDGPAEMNLKDEGLNVSSASHSSNDSGVVWQPRSTPTPISPVPESPAEFPSESEPSSSQSRPIPPPPTPRRHKSGILLSRVRAHTSGSTFKSSSRSFGDLSESVLGMSCIGDQAGPSSTSTVERSPTKRNVSEGGRKRNEESDDDNDMWDNSARFYHHIHSRSASRAASRAVSPSHSPVASPRSLSQGPGSPIFLRRNMTIPAGLGPGTGPLSASLSPNHLFLQQHLPPTFGFTPADQSSPETTLSEPHPHHSMVILTPTTQEWRELRKENNENVDEEEIPSSDSSDDDLALHRTVSVGSEDLQSSGSGSGSSIRPPPPDRPALYATRSVDFLEKETRHTPDPGSLVATPSREAAQPVFSTNVIAPSPGPMDPLDSKVGTLAEPDTPAISTRAKRRSLQDSEDLPDLAPDEEGDSSPNQDDAPARFASIGRRDSLRIIKKVGESEAPRTKSKRELERERLFRMVDEEVEESTEKSVYGIQKIGRGGLSPSESRSQSKAQSQSQPRPDPFSVSVKEPSPREKTQSLPVEKTSPTSSIHSHKSISPTQPLKPSPLHASPYNATNGLPTPTTPSPAESPALATDLTDFTQTQTQPSRPVLPAPENTGERIDIMRDYARALQTHHSARLDAPSKHHESVTASPPRSPRSPRVRDMTRQSLVAGRIVQPYAPTPGASMPPPERPGMFRQASSLQSFSPFRSPQLSAARAGASTPGGLMPHLSRLDSTISLAPSTGVPSECGTPSSETAAGMGGHGISDYVILKEAGKGAYGLVMRAKVKGPKGEPIGDEVIIKYIIKARILADCWKKHKQLGPIPVELHVMDQLRHLMYNPPTKPNPWDPTRSRANGEPAINTTTTHLPGSVPAPFPSTKTNGHANGNGDMPPMSKSSTDSKSSISSMDSVTSKQDLAHELELVLNRGHPNIVKLLDFFEDREFYYLVMPRYGTGLDLFDRIESSPEGLESFEIRTLMGQLSDAVRFLHANGIVHRDIKDENVILDGQGRCQLIDFGSAAHWRPGKKWDTFSGTMHYASPEIVRGEHYGGKEQDVYALGVVAYVLLIGEPPFSVLPDEALAGLTPDGPASEALARRCDETPDVGREADGGGRLGDVADLVRQCMQFELADRPTAEVMCNHRYLVGEGGWVGYKGWLPVGQRVKVEPEPEP